MSVMLHQSICRATCCTRRRHERRLIFPNDSSSLLVILSVQFILQRFPVMLTRGCVSVCFYSSFNAGKKKTKTKHMFSHIGSESVSTFDLRQLFLPFRGSPLG